jgi:aminoglycoside phosphotransferase (APT) family kinase protein
MTAADPPGIDHAAVEGWMAAHVDGLVPPVRFTLISGGHSNITYFVDDASGRSYVMRRPPLGVKPGNAHNIAREFAVIGALADTAVPVPRALALGDDEAVNGSSFYVMSRVDGSVVENPSRADEYLPTEASRRRASEQIVDVLAALHAVDIDAVGLGTLARRDGFLDRQLKRIGAVWEQNKTRELPLMDKLHSRLVATQPAQRYTGIVHSDYRMGNVMFAPDGTLTGVLDWELWTLGDPLADLGFLLNSWGESNDTTPEVLMQVPPTKAPGFLNRAEVTARYASQTGFDVSNIEYYQAFQHWKIAVIAEGVKRRYESAQMASTDVDFAHLSQRVIDMAGMARDLLDQIS